MEQQQNLAATPALPTAQKPSARASKYSILDPRKQIVVDYFALQGLMTDEEGNIKKMPLTELAAIIGVDRNTIYDWRDNRIPDFWERVAESRARLGGQNRVQKVWNGVYLKAAQGNPEQAKLFLSNFDPSFRMPNDKAERNTAETLIDLMNAARQLQAEQNRTEAGQAPLTAAPVPDIPEGEVVPRNGSSPS